MEARPAAGSYDASGRLLTDRTELDADVRAVSAAVALLVTTPVDVDPWEAVPDLLESSPSDRHFVAEIDDDGRANLRFGDGQYGSRLGDVVSLHAVYRVGNGRAGNVGAEAIAHAAPTLAAGWLTAIRNPLAARGGVDAETIEEVRQLAPQAFHSELFRAVTVEDWAEAARRLPDIQGAVATYRWTGSWYTVFVAVDPSDRADLVDLPNGRTRLEPAFERRVRAFLTRFRLAGYDVELRPPRFVPLDIEIEVCAAPGHFRADVAAAVRRALSAQVLPDGTLGFFHPENFTFGEPLYLSRLYAAVERVEGVESAVVRRFQRYGEAAGELESGVLRRAVGDRAARQRPELRRARRADRDLRGEARDEPPVWMLRAAAAADAAPRREPSCPLGDRLPDRHLRELPRVDARGDRPTPDLAPLTTRVDDDYTVTVLDLWAAVADVLTFYQERYANEAFLRTATRRESVAGWRG